MHKLKEEVKDQSSKLTVETLKLAFNSEHNMSRDANLWGDWDIARIRNALVNGVDERLTGKLHLHMDKRIQEFEKYINSEMFLTEIIKRINNKQLGGQNG